MTKRKTKGQKVGESVADFSCSLIGGLAKHSISATSYVAKGVGKGLLKIATKRSGLRPKPAIPVEKKQISTGRFQPLDASNITVRIKDVAGLDAVKKLLLEEVINPFIYPEVYERFKVNSGSGILLYGPPGCGKTHIAKAIAGEMDAAFFQINPGDIKSPVSGETERRLEEIFEEASRHKIAVLFFDEIDNLLSKRGNRKINAVTQFLQLSDGLIKSDTCVLLLGASNKPGAIDEAALRPGRFSNRIYVGLPEQAACAEIIDRSLTGLPLAEALPIKRLASQTAERGYSGADVAEICRLAKKTALKRQLESECEEVITTNDFEEAIQQVACSVRPEQLDEFEKWFKPKLI